jgi:hypothetical protein
MEKKSHQVLIDNRTTEAKEKDFDSREIVASSTEVKYLTRAKAVKVIGLYPERNQKGESSCAANAGAETLGQHEVVEGRPFKRLSSSFIYRLRSNFDKEGMYVYNLGEIGSNIGTPLDSTLPIQGTEEKVNAVVITDAMKKEAAQFRGGAHFGITTLNIDAFVAVCNGLGLPATLFVWGSQAEWSKEIPEVLDETLTLEKAYVRHLVTILPNSGYTYKKKKYFIIKDSSHFGGRVYRHISEDWVKRRVVMGLYWLTLPNPTNEPVAPKISFKYEFKRDLTVGHTGEDVVKLQDALRELGYFTYPESTGYFGGYTRSAVKAFQLAFRDEILTPLGLSVATGYFGLSSRSKVHKLMGL